MGSLFTVVLQSHEMVKPNKSMPGGSYFEVTDIRTRWDGPKSEEYQEGLNPLTSVETLLVLGFKPSWI